MSRLGRAIVFAGRNGRVLLEAWISLLVTDLGLRWLPLPWVRRLLLPATSQRASGTLSSSAPLIRLVDISARYHLFPMRCLTRALVLQRLLLQRGLISELRIGVRRSGRELEAHAWLEHRGSPVGERRDVALRFTPLVAAGAEG